MSECLGSVLGFVKMPEGYELRNTEIGQDGHWYWFHPESDLESAIHWDYWAVYRWAKEHKTQQANNT